MKKLIWALPIALVACTTPQTTLKNMQTGQVVTCGGNVSSSLAGGAIGYHIQKSNDKDCVITYQSQGFTVISAPPPEPPPANNPDPTRKKPK